MEFCNQSGSKVRVAIHWSGGLNFGTSGQFSSWTALPSGRCMRRGAGNGREEFIVLVQESGWIRWNTLTPSNRRVVRRNQNVGYDGYSLKPSQSFLCAHPKEDRRGRRRYIDARDASKTTCPSGEQVYKNLFVYSSQFLRGTRHGTVILTADQVVLR
ncbi:hypothetical protein [Pseudaestuariivita atlantica]|uniref:Uncharacterized protein n=1 Tax=Pseudaestuariivita atlantica TaxID=1317121 RepID=A0A0L1JRD2_9RHOB|nr:hypothetical protein [Pseudaestuariivita atlantica]KNG94310.1 hypothetical protein ATO11_08895 [Pseudaestuariivita atlantica]